MGSAAKPRTPGRPPPRSQRKRSHRLLESSLERLLERRPPWLPRAFCTTHKVFASSASLPPLQVFYQRAGGQEEVAEVKEASAVNVTLGGLQGYSLYSVTVAAFNRIGTGPRAPKVPERITTLRARKFEALLTFS